MKRRELALWGHAHRALLGERKRERSFAEGGADDMHARSQRVESDGQREREHDGRRGRDVGFVFARQGEGQALAWCHCVDAEAQADLLLAAILADTIIVVFTGDVRASGEREIDAARAKKDRQGRCAPHLGSVPEPTGDA